MYQDKMQRVRNDSPSTRQMWGAPAPTQTVKWSRETSVALAYAFIEKSKRPDVHRKSALCWAREYFISAGMPLHARACQLAANSL